ncbi:helix-turn-helix transcriptional regulator [Streptococcus porcinus]|uniref:Helix-turn-helix transcriptional regulator n=1 Tax=Streptococcus porcinus TaxID=1340 RepID=A0A7V9WSG9_STRPO|nr:helix-turn-helix transcriptional regulator [Streptococcus porcinus]MBA2796241.1 helix-turn-helix transcriptional regulator [Streptococcus porcinus]
MIENFAPNLIRLRKQKGLSQKELAQELGLNKQSISEIENGRRFPTFTNLKKIAKYFNATPTQLFGTSQQIELERVMLQTDEYSRKAEKILSAVSAFENFVKKYDYQKIIEFGFSLKE